MPQGAQLLPPGTMQLPQGAKLVTQMPVPGQIGQPPLGNMPIRASITGPLAVTSATGIPMVTMGMTLPSQAMGQPVTSAAITSPGMLANSQLFTPQPLAQQVAMTQAAVVSSAINLQPIGQPAVANMDCLRTDVPTALPQQQRIETTPNKDTPASTPTTPAKESEPVKADLTVKSDAKPAESKCDKEVKEEKVDSDFDPANAMEWKDGIGCLPGSDLKVIHLHCL